MKDVHHVEWKESSRSGRKIVKRGKAVSESGVSHQEIVDYWERREDECRLGVDWAEARKRCWRCGYRSTLRRCHIIPDPHGGPKSPHNLVLLCGRCHREAPNVADPRFMWIWLSATCVPHYDMYWTNRGIEEFERIFGRRPFEAHGFAELTEERVLALLREEVRKTTVHFGEGRVKPSTIACTFALIEERVAGQLPSRSRTHS